MRNIITILGVVVLCGSVSACYTAAVATAGAAGGYVVAKDAKNK